MISETIDERDRLVGVAEGAKVDKAGWLGFLKRALLSQRLQPGVTIKGQRGGQDILQAIHASEGLLAAEQTAERVKERPVEMKLREAAKQVEESIYETLAYLQKAEQADSGKSG